MQATAETMEQTTLVAGAATGAMSFLMGASANLLFGVINTIQMYVHFPLFDISFPPNIFAILKVFIGIAQLDLITDDDLWVGTFNYEPSVGMDPFNNRFELLSYETKSIIYNLGDLSIMQFYVFVGLIWLLIYYLLVKASCCCHCMAKRKEKYEKKYGEQKKELFYNWPIRFLFEAYLELAMAT
jgi:hypothetical protein